jgi:hypothetical protein
MNCALASVAQCSQQRERLAFDELRMGNSVSQKGPAQQ